MSPVAFEKISIHRPGLTVSPFRVAALREPRKTSSLCWPHIVVELLVKKRGSETETNQREEEAPGLRLAWHIRELRNVIAAQVFLLKATFGLRCSGDRYTQSI